MDKASRMSIRKVLTRNDTGENDSHQWGMCIPKQPEFLAFFPHLDPSVKNPRAYMHFKDKGGAEWVLHFIYYNNKLFGGTRNEYRLTMLPPFIQDRGLRAGDSIILTREPGRGYLVDSEKATPQDRVAEGELRLSGKWKIVRI